MHRQPICPRRRRAAPRHALASFAMVLCAGLTLSDAAQAQPEHAGASRIAAAAPAAHPSAQRATAGNTRPEVLSPIPDQSHTEGDSVDLDLSTYFSDPDGDTLNFSAATPLPHGLSLVGERITGTIDYDAAASSPYSIRIFVSDRKRGFASGRFLWTVIANRPPGLAKPFNDLTLTEGEAVSFDLDAFFEDPDGDAPIFSAVGSLPPDVLLSADGQVSGIVAAGAATGSPYAITFIADDVRGGRTSTTSIWFVIGNTNRPPLLLGTVPDQGNVEGDDVGLDLGSFFADPDGDVLTFSLDGDLPAGLSLAADGLVTGTIGPTAAADSPYSITVTADDGISGHASDTLGWVVRPSVVLFVDRFEPDE